MFDYTEEIWSTMDVRDESQWRCYCTAKVAEHTVSEHNKVTHEAVKERGFEDVYPE